MAADTDPDVQLMLALQAGQLPAFDQLFAKHIAGVVAFATQFVRNRARAEELAQDVFLQVYKNRHTYTPTARFITWLYRMVSNACVSEARRSEHRHRYRPPATADSSEPEPIEVPTSSSEDDVASHEGIERIRGALEELPPQQRAALLLARVEGLSYEEVASALETSVSAVKSLVHRATLSLRARLGEEGSE